MESDVYDEGQPAYYLYDLYLVQIAYYEIFFCHLINCQATSALNRATMANTAGLIVSDVEVNAPANAIK